MQCSQEAYWVHLLPAVSFQNKLPDVFLVQSEDERFDSGLLRMLKSKALNGVRLFTVDQSAAEEVEGLTLEAVEEKTDEL